VAAPASDVSTLYALHWFGMRTTPIPIFRRTGSGYFWRSFSANFLVLKLFDKITSSNPLYSNSTHRSFIQELSQLLNNLPQINPDRLVAKANLQTNPVTGLDDRFYFCVYQATTPTTSV
jgi:hypothetical protein